MMNFGAFSILLGCLFTFGHCVFPPGSCDNYTNITEPWRNFRFKSSSFPGFPKDDAHLVGKWLRFTGIGGERVLYTCTSGAGAGSKYMINLPSPLQSYESPKATLLYAYPYVASCYSFRTNIYVVLCPGKFYIYKPYSHPQSNATYATYHYICETDSCGPLAECAGNGGCECVSGYEIPPEHLPTQYSYGCADIDECERSEKVCDPLSDCKNTIGSFLCVCWDGYEAQNPKLPTGLSNKCKDINECLDTNICGDHGDCANDPGSYMCECDKGFDNEPDPKAVCQDIDECLNATVCGPYAVCTNIPGAFTCACQQGFKPTDADEEPGVTNICIDIDECVENVTICGPLSNCTNQIGSHNCTCDPGYRGRNADRIASIANPCTDIDECSETPGICGKLTICTNVEGTFYCSCPDGLYPSTGLLWEVGVSFCQNLQDILDEINPPEGQTKERAFLGHMDTQLKDKDSILPVPTVTNCFSAAMEVSGVGPRIKLSNVSSEGDGETGSFILKLSDSLLSAVVEQGQNQTERTVTTPTVDLSVRTILPGSQNSETSALSANGNTMEINLEDMAKNNNGSAAAAFMILKGMESLLSHQYFETENLTEMNSDVITAVLPFMNNTNLTEPVNFTIYHKKIVPENGLVTCVYWEDKTEEKEEGREEGEKNKMMRWSVEGCQVAYTSENYTVCSCSHLSTFALIMQIGEPPPENPFLDWLNRICVIVGLFFFGLAIFTFLLCSWNPKINNTARLHLCINLALSHLLLLWNDRYTDHELACTVMAGLLHFLVVASFVWMLLEALQLHLLVRRLSKVQVIQRDGLPKPLLYMIGYGVPFVIVGTSALIYSDGYGATEAEVCWLSRKRSFNWALTGPVIAVIGLNWILFCATLWSLKPTLVNMKSGVSQSKEIRLVVFKILAQFVILGCTWILGLYQTNLFFQVLFIFLNSQQGTFLFIVHCVLNKEVREEYIKFLTCSFNKQREEGSKREASMSEDLDKAEENKK
ncbi:adhesion G protein-coupled receptor E1-like [Labrus bergylta]|uniref:adhesion G protein-coupled receptor E1-like n=1 Tax=Labrus bergylta TaxID=56723 RepID=UPI0033141D84